MKVETPKLRTIFRLNSTTDAYHRTYNTSSASSAEPPDIAGPYGPPSPPSPPSPPETSLWTHGACSPQTHRPTTLLLLEGPQYPHVPPLTGATQAHNDRHPVSSTATWQHRL